MDFSSAADELYGVRPAEFVATRKRLAREAKDAGDRPLAERIGALRRPTLSAWAVNLLARSAAGELERLLDTGAEIRSAWSSGGGLGDLEQRRARLVDSLVRTAGELAAAAGNPLREQAVREVEDTLQAATVDAGVADEVRLGRLSQPRSHTGFVPAGFPMAPGDGKRRAGPEGGETPRKPAPTKKPPEKAAPEKPAGGAKARSREEAEVTRTSAARRRRAETLRRRAEAAERRLAEREERAEEAREEADAASAEVGRLRQELERAVAARDAAVRRAERAEQNRARAREETEEARGAAREARAAADRDARHA